MHPLLLLLTLPLRHLLLDPLLALNALDQLVLHLAQLVPMRVFEEDHLVGEVAIFFFQGLDFFLKGFHRLAC